MLWLATAKSYPFIWVFTKWELSSNMQQLQQILKLNNNIVYRARKMWSTNVTPRFFIFSFLETTCRHGVSLSQAALCCENALEYLLEQRNVKEAQWTKKTRAVGCEWCNTFTSPLPCQRGWLKHWRLPCSINTHTSSGNPFFSCLRGLLIFKLSLLFLVFFFFLWKPVACLPHKHSVFWKRKLHTPKIYGFLSK